MADDEGAFYLERILSMCKCTLPGPFSSLEPTIPPENDPKAHCCSINIKKDDKTVDIL